MKYEPKSALKHISKVTAKGIDAIDRISDIQHTLNHAITAISNEVKKLRSKSFMTDIPVSTNEFKMLNEAIRTLIACEKQQLESMKIQELTAKFAEMTDTELLEQVRIITDGDITTLTASKQAATPESDDAQ